MQALPGRPSFDQIAKKWHDLAERRLAHYTELYRSGRWQHYYTQELFATRMLDVINAAKKWRALAAGLQNTDRAEEPTRRDDKMRPAA
jgi:uncharacterized repeat protein (TIGR03809 family)